MLRAIWLIVRKDLTVEVRSRELAYTTLFFAVSCVLVFAFSLVQEGRAAEGVGAGVLWMAIMFAGNLALGRTFERERQSETLRALDAGAGAEAGRLSRQAASASSCCSRSRRPCSCRWWRCSFERALLSHPFWLASVVATGTVGFAAVGTLFAAMLVRARSRDVLLPVLLYPITVPVHHCRGARHGCHCCSPNSRWTSFVSGSCCSSPSTSCSSRWHCGPSNR